MKTLVATILMAANIGFADAAQRCTTTVGATHVCTKCTTPPSNIVTICDSLDGSSPRFVTTCVGGQCSTKSGQ